MQEVRDVVPDLMDHILREDANHWYITLPCTCSREERASLVEPIFDNGSGKPLEPKSRSAIGFADKPIVKTKRASSLSLSSRVQPKAARQLNAHDLTHYFRAMASPRMRLGLNFVALRGTFARWRREGIPSVEIKAMIDVYLREATPPTYAPAWKVFVKHQEKWRQRAEHVLKERESEAHRYDKDWWLGKK